MVCRFCNREIPDGARFCTLCGAKQELPAEEVVEVEAVIPVEEPVEVEAVAPVEETVEPEEVAPVEEPAEAEKVAPVEEPAETEEVAPVEEPAETEEVTPVEEPAETEEVTPAEEPAETEEVAPVEEPAAPKPMGYKAPAIQLPTGRGLAAMIFLSFLTLGIYPLVVWSKISGEINIVASRHDGKRSAHYLTVLLLSLPTCFLLPLIWSHKICRRIHDELKRRRIVYAFGARTLWLWEILYCSCTLAVAAVVFIVLLTLTNVAGWVYIAVGAGFLAVFCVGPFIFIHKIMKAMNLLNTHFNHFG